MECIVCIKTIDQKKEEYMNNSLKYLILFVYTIGILYLLKFISVQSAS